MAYIRWSVVSLVALALAFLISAAPSVVQADNPVTVAATPQLTSSNAPCVVITWQTGDELETAGYNIYRSEQKDGVYQKINSTLIPTSTDILAGGKYTFEDAAVRPGQTYYYQLEVVTLNWYDEPPTVYTVTASAWADVALNSPTPAASAPSSILPLGGLTVFAAGVLVGLWRVFHG